MDKEILSTNKAPAAIGPYSQGIAGGNVITQRQSRPRSSRLVSGQSGQTHVLFGRYQ